MIPSGNDALRRDMDKLEGEKDERQHGKSARQAITSGHRAPWVLAA